MNDKFIKYSDAVREFCGQPTELRYPSWYAEQLNNLPACNVRPNVTGYWVESRKHLWECDIGFHNGPVCSKCGYRPCVHCNPDYDKEDCSGSVHYICSVCGRTEFIKEPFCNCGAEMMNEG